MRLDEIYMEYRDRVEFYLVYIQEIHPSDGWQVLSNVHDGCSSSRRQSTRKPKWPGSVC